MTLDPRWRIRVDARCIGSGLCLATAPRHFLLVDGRAAPRRPVVPATDDDVTAAADLCPMEAITVVASTPDGRLEAS